MRELTAIEQQQLRDELTLNGGWDYHVLNNEHLTALQDGRSIHVNSVLNEKFVNSLFYKFPLTHQILKSVAGDRVIARCYWHKLEIGDTISEHDDSKLFNVVQGRLDNRYQIYLSCPDNIMTVDSQPVNAKTFENKIVDLDLTQTHGYVNNSIEPWIFLVFDVLKPGINLI